MNDRGVWKKHELKWLYGQDAPLLLGVVDLKRWCVRLYSPTRMWWVMFKYFWPGEVILVPDLEPASNIGRDFDRQLLPTAHDGGRCGVGTVIVFPLAGPLSKWLSRKRKA